MKLSESVASSIASNLNRMGGAQDLTHMLCSDDYFSEINPRSMRRLMNVACVTGELECKMLPRLLLFSEIVKSAHVINSFQVDY